MYGYRLFDHSKRLHTSTQCNEIPHYHMAAHPFLWSILTPFPSDTLIIPLNSGDCKHTCTIHRMLPGQLQRKELLAAKSPDGQLNCSQIFTLCPQKPILEIHTSHFKQAEFLTSFKDIILFYTETLRAACSVHSDSIYRPSTPC
jgi:hypothetical protein